MERYINETLQKKKHITNMEILNIIISYIIIGICVSFLTDLQRDWLMRKEMFEQELYDNWGILERIFVVVLWPMAVIIYIKGFIE
tara:strand:- start:210 stop:464 length:255 start_codon:yes stop_codon:yes gene_type:complete